MRPLAFLISTVAVVVVVVAIAIVIVTVVVTVTVSVTVVLSLCVLAFLAAFSIWHLLACKFQGPEWKRVLEHRFYWKALLMFCFGVDSGGTALQRICFGKPDQGFCCPCNQNRTTVRTTALRPVETGVEAQTEDAAGMEAEWNGTRI